MNAPDSPLTEERVREIFREELAKALGMLVREASHLNGYDTDIIEGTALSAIEKTAEGAANRITCPHEAYTSVRIWSTGGMSPGVCARCGEPEPEPENPFEEKTNG